MATKSNYADAYFRAAFHNSDRRTACGSFELCAENQCFRHSSENVQSECKCCCKKYKGNGVG